MPLDDIEMGKLLQRIDDLSDRVEGMTTQMKQWQPIIDEALKQQQSSRARNLTLTTAAICSGAVWIITAAVWYIRSGNPVPVKTVDPTSPPAQYAPYQVPRSPTMPERR